jgi:hypothetical protein
MTGRCSFVFIFKVMKKNYGLNVGKITSQTNFSVFEKIVLCNVESEIIKESRRVIKLIYAEHIIYQKSTSA